MQRSTFFFFILFLLLTPAVEGQTHLPNPQEAVSVLVDHLLASLEPIEASIIDFENDAVILDVGRRADARIGQRFELYSEDQGLYVGLVEIKELRTRQSVAVFIDERREAQIGDLADEVEGGTVAVYRFIYQGEETELSRSLQEMAITLLSRKAGFTVVESTVLEQQLEELQLTYAGLLEHEAVQAGSMCGANFVLLCSIDVQGDDVTVFTRFIETGSGGTLSTTEVRFPRTPSIDRQLQLEGSIQERKEEEPRPDLHDTPSTEGYRIEIQGDVPEKLFPGDMVELDAFAFDPSDLRVPLQIRWSLCPDSVGEAILDVMADDRAILTVLSPGNITVRASAEDIHGLIEIEGKASPYVQNMSISPPLVAIYSGEEQLFQVQGIDQYGDPIAVEAHWSIVMGEGTLTRERGENTLFTGHVPGVVVVQARVESIVVAGSIEVVKAPAVLTSLALKVDGSLQIEEGENLQLEGIPLDQYGERMNVPVNWSIVRGTGRLSSSTGAEITFTATISGTVVVQVVSGRLEETLEIQVFYRVSGQVVDEEGRGIPDVMIAFSGGYGSVTTASDGEWSRDGLQGTVMVTAAKKDYTFREDSRQVTGSVTGLNFTGRKFYAVSGRVVDEEGRGIPGVMIAFSGGYGSVTTASDGEWSRDGLQGTVMVTAAKEDYTFREDSRQVTGSVTGLNFTGRKFYAVSGRVVDSGGQGIGGVEISFSGDYSSVTTDSSGDWNKSALQGTVIVTPSNTAYAFTPTSTEVRGEETRVGFTGRKVGTQTSHLAGNVRFHMRLAPAAAFPMGIDDDEKATVDEVFWIAETQVTYELWYAVRRWALENGYTFANDGREGSCGNTGGAPSIRGKEPVTEVSWYDCIVWCNALSEFLGYNPVYTLNRAVIKDAMVINHRDVIVEDRDGFRLPTNKEWELAARYKGSDSSHGALEYPAGSGSYWTPGIYASGATADYNNAAANQVAAWYIANSTRTKYVGQKPLFGNGLKLYDMSGNVQEWCFTESGWSMVLRGGSWFCTAHKLRVGNMYRFFPGSISHLSGFRLVRTSM